MTQTIDFVPGDTVRVSEKIKEGEKHRLQVFEGVVLGIRGRGENKTFSVMKTVGGIGVEKIYPINSPNVARVVVSEHSKERVRRAKLYYKRLPRKNP